MNAVKPVDISSTKTTVEPPQRRLEVHVEYDANGRPCTVLEDLSWGEGVGWYVQKTLRLDPAQVDALLGALCCVRQGASADTAPGSAQPGSANHAGTTDCPAHTARRVEEAAAPRDGRATDGTIVRLERFLPRSS